jgi:branched-chain amino acid transport system permease protein
VICIVLIYLFYHSPFATVLKGSRDNLERLTFVGMNTQNVRLFACMVSSFFVAIAGILYAMRNMGAFPVMFSTNTSTEGLVMCLIGGMQAFFGPILGAVIVTFISTQVSILTNYYQFILGAIIVFCVLFLQNGLLRDDVTRNLDAKKGGFLSYGMGNDGMNNSTAILALCMPPRTFPSRFPKVRFAPSSAPTVPVSPP